MFNKEQTFFSREAYFLIALIAVTVVTMFPFIFTGFATGDDVEYYITANTLDIWSESYQYAQRNGRFYFVFMMPIFYQWLPYIFDNLIATKFINVLFIVMNYFLFALIIKEIFKNKWLGFLCYLIGLVFISIKGENNPIVSYPIYFSLSFSLILLSLFCAIKFNYTQLRKYKNLSVVFFALGLLFYENYLIYLPLILGFITYHQFADHSAQLVSKLKRAFILVMPFTIVVFFYLLAYIGWRLVFNQYQYSGAMVAAHNSIWDVFNTITSISKGAYPLFFYFSEHSVFTENSYILQNHEHGLPNVFLHAKTEWVFKAIIVSLLFFYIIHRVFLVNKRKVLLTGIIGAVFIYSPQFLLASTEKYMTLVKCCGITNYLTTYFSVFPVALLLGIILLIPIFFISQEKYSIPYKVFISLLIGLACIVNDYSNDHALTDLKNPLYTFQAFDELVKTKAFKAIPTNSFIYSPQLYIENSEISTMFGQDYDWSDYFYHKSGKKIFAPRLVAGFKHNKKISNYYYLNYGHNRKTVDRFFALARVDRIPENALESTVYADSVEVYYYSTYKSFSVILNTKNVPSDSSIFVNGKKYPMKTNNIELYISYNNKNDLFKPIKICVNDIDVKKIAVLHNSNSLGIPIALE